MEAETAVPVSDDCEGGREGVFGGCLRFGSGLVYAGDSDARDLVEWT